MKAIFDNRLTQTVGIMLIVILVGVYGLFVAGGNVRADSTTVSVATPEELEKACEDQEDGTEIRLGMDLVIGDGQKAMVVDGKSLALDLAGHTITWDRGHIDELILVENEGHLTIRDSAAVGNSSFNYSVTRDDGGTESRTYEGGYITSTGSDALWRLVHITGNSSFTLESGAIYGNTNGGTGAGLLAEDRSTVTLKSGVIAGNIGNGDGGGLYIKDSDLDITGEVIITDNTSKDRGGGIAADNSSVDITENASNAYITGNSSRNTDGRPWGDGGGIYLSGSTTFTMKAGHINGNVSPTGGGGGICAGFYNGGGAGHSVKIDIQGGYICANRSHCEGGGISIGSACSAKIVAKESKIFIEGNVVDDDTSDWGGGGVFVASAGSGEGKYGNPGTLYTEGVLITGNTAKGFGGGVAGCATGRLFINEKGDGLDVNTKGGGIFENYALATHDENYVATGHLSGKTSSKNEDHTYTDGNVAFWEGGFQDYFCALNTRVGEDMLGGGTENWKGTADSVEIDNPASDEADKTVLASYLTGLTSYADGGAKNQAMQDATVFIRYNTSGTHGGGILTNGILTIGAKPTSLEVYDRITVYADKAVKKENGDAAKHPEDGFVFDISDADGNVINTIRSFTTDKEKGIGELAAALPYSYSNGETNTYFISERADQGADYRTDSTVYRIDLTGEVKEEVIQDLFGNETNMKISVIKEITVYADGEEILTYDGSALRVQGEEVEEPGDKVNLNTGVDHAKLLYLDKALDEPVFTNIYIEKEKPTPEPTETPQPEDTAQPTATPTPEVTTQPTEPPIPEAVETPRAPLEPTATPMPTATAAPVATVQPTETPVPTNAPVITPKPTEEPVLYENPADPDDPDLSEMDDGDTPLGSKYGEDDKNKDTEETVLIEEDGVPRSALDETVETGDSSPIGGCVAGMAISILGMIVIISVLGMEEGKR